MPNKPKLDPVWGESAATPSDLEKPSDAFIRAGWPRSTTPPARQKFNYVLNWLSNAVHYILRKGIAEYYNDLVYSIGDRTVSTNGKTYVCKVAGTVGKPPESNPTEWDEWGFTVIGIKTAIDYDKLVKKTGDKGAALIPSGTTLERPSPTVGSIRFNTTLNSYEGGVGAGFQPLGGGATGGEGDKIFHLNDLVVKKDFTIPVGSNAGTFGPISIADGVTVTISDDSTWSVI